MPKRFCLDCTQLTDNGSRCKPCQARLMRNVNAKRGTTKQRGLGGTHRRAAEKIVKAAKYCAICGNEPTESDPLTADHVIPRSRGGSEDSPLIAVHRSCNSRRGNKPL